VTSLHDAPANPMTGADVDDVLGHSMPTLVSTYQRGPAYQRKRAALQAWADFVAGAAADNVVSLRA
jgi:hypothetical protein